MNIVVAGKGGVGKTIVSALLINKLSQLRKSNILAIDADPNSNLNLLLGLNFEKTLADIREDFKNPSPDSGVNRVEYLKFCFQDILVESENFDFLVMGRPEGPGCYCAVNNLLREIISQFSKHYQYIIIDSEAGMEHLSRRTAANIDILILVSEPTIAALQAVLRSREIAQKLDFKVRKTIYLINKLRENLSDKLKQFLVSNSLKPYYILPQSENLNQIYEEGKLIYDFKDRKFLENIDIIIEKEILNNGGER